jgi:hypothetical protein
MKNGSARQIDVEGTMRNRCALNALLVLPVILSFGVLACDYRGGVGDTLSVRPIAPTNGGGMPRTPSSSVAHPIFRWSATPAASRFELQIDDSCTSTASCSFPSPEIDETALTSTTYTPSNGLAGGSSAPVAHRYYWHVRACSGEACGSWSAVRYVVVGTQFGFLNADLNGDGYEDAVVAAPTSSAGAQRAGQVAVYLGGPAVSASPTLVISHDRALEELGTSVAMVGDVNGDGFGDFLVRAQGDESTPGVAPAAHAYVYFGGQTLRTTPDVVLDCGSVDDENGAAAGIGDVNGDGYDDVAIGGMTVDADHHGLSPSRVDVHFGGPTMANAPHLTLLGEAWNPVADFFGSAIAGVGDINDDGHPDFVVGSHQSATGSGGGLARIYFGGPSLDATPDRTLQSPTGGNAGLFGFSVAGLGDVNGDGISDLAVGAPFGGPSPDPTLAPAGAVHVYFGGAVPSSAPSLTFHGTDQRAWFGAIVAGAHDVDGDGRNDIAVMTRGAVEHTPTSAPPTNARVDVFLGGATAATSPAFTHAAGPAAEGRRGLAVRDLDGDSRPDLLVGRFVTDNQGTGLVDVALGAQGLANTAVTLSGAAPGDQFGAVIGR